MLIAETACARPRTQSTGIKTGDRAGIRRRDPRSTLLATDTRPQIEPPSLGRSPRLTAVVLDASPAVRLPDHYRRPRKPREERRQQRQKKPGTDEQSRQPALDHSLRHPH